MRERGFFTRPSLVGQLSWYGAVPLDRWRHLWTPPKWQRVSLCFWIHWYEFYHFSRLKKDGFKRQQPNYWFLWFLKLWSFSEALDLKIFPHGPHGTEIPAIWFASMWCIILVMLPSFPQTLQILALPPFPLYGLAFSLNVIIDFTCWSNTSMLVLLVASSVRTRALSAGRTFSFSLRWQLFDMVGGHAGLH